MTHKDYALLATALASSKPADSYGDVYVFRYHQWRKDVNAVADAIARDNSRFNYARFYEACGYQEIESPCPATPLSAQNGRNSQKSSQTTSLMRKESN